LQADLGRRKKCLTAYNDNGLVLHSAPALWQHLLPGGSRRSSAACWTSAEGTLRAYHAHWHATGPLTLPDRTPHRAVALCTQALHSNCGMRGHLGQPLAAALVCYPAQAGPLFAGTTVGAAGPGVAVRACASAEKRSLGTAKKPVQVHRPRVRRWVRTSAYSPVTLLTHAPRHQGCTSWSASEGSSVTPPSTWVRPRGSNR
jgi:hypothetical protein